MPVHINRDSNGCYAIWGEHGKKYYYTCGNKDAQQRARAKAYNQGVAQIISDSNKLSTKLAKEKVSFDYDGTLTVAANRDIATGLVNNGNIVYIISARSDKGSLLTMADKLRIPHSRVFATGSNEEKIKKIKELGITKHYDNNSDVIKALGNIGIQV